MLAAMTWGQWTLAALLTFVCFLMMVVILLQKGRGGGLAGAFGGAGGTSAFGAKTGDVFTWITCIGAGIFVLLTVVGNFAFDQSGSNAAPQVELLPLDDATPTEEGSTKTLPIKIGGNIELGTTDPVTGETKTTMVPLDGVPTNAQPVKPAEGAAAPTPPPATDSAAKPEPQPEPAPETKKEEKAPSTP